MFAEMKNLVSNLTKKLETVQFILVVNDVVIPQLVTGDTALEAALTDIMSADINTKVKVYVADELDLVSYLTTFITDSTDDTVSSVDIDEEDINEEYQRYVVSTSETVSAPNNEVYTIAQYTLDNQHIGSFVTVKEAAESTDTNITSLRKVLNGQRQTANNYIWKRI